MVDRICGVECEGRGEIEGEEVAFQG